jgi:glyoxylase-like metal-dependent hydrolase (beta-lactamase superfamily II)
VVLVLALVVAAGVLGVAHVAIRALAPPLPEPAQAAAALEADGEWPVRVAWVETAYQGTPRSQVLDRGRDPDPGAPYTMSHPAFVIEWADGRRLAVDAGMSAEAARAFGAPLRWVGAGEIHPGTALAAALGPAAARLGGLLFTHLHTDHTQGALAVCAAVGERRLAWWRTPTQAERGNHTTRPGRAQLVDEAGCLEPHDLEPGPLAPVPGFPGLRVVPVAGHTPGSQVVLVATRRRDGTGRRLALTGDVANHVAGIRHDVPKPTLYRWLVVPESEAALGRARHFLRDLEAREGFDLAVAHHREQLESLGLPRLDR